MRIEIKSNEFLGWCFKCKNRKSYHTTCGSDLCKLEKHPQPCYACGNTKWGKGKELEILICEDFENEN